MNHLIRKATLLAFGALLVAGAANAGAPSSANSTKPVGLSLMGTDGSGGPGPDAVDPHGNVYFTIRDAVPNVIPGATVTLGFMGCPQISISNNVKRSDATIDCTAKTVSSTTNGSGVATFSVVGTSAGYPSPTPRYPDPDPVPGLYPGCVTVTVTVPGFPPAPYPNMIGAAMDHTGIGGVDGGDISFSVDDRLGLPGPIPNYAERSDYDVAFTPGAVTGGDLSIMVDVRLGIYATGPSPVPGSTVSGIVPCTP